MTTYTKPHRWSVSLRYGDRPYTSHGTIEVIAPTAADALVMAPLQLSARFGVECPVAITNLEYIPEKAP